MSRTLEIETALKLMRMALALLHHADAARAAAPLSRAIDEATSEAGELVVRAAPPNDETEEGA